MPRDNSKRVLEGARHLSPMLGHRMTAVWLDGCGVVVRELIPQDLKLDAQRITETAVVKAAHFLALVIGRAHAGQMGADMRRAWFAELAQGRTRSVSCTVIALAQHRRAHDGV